MSRKTILKTYIGLALSLGSVQCWAVAETDVVGQENKLVEIENRVDILKPYKLRRQTTATTFSLHKTSLNPEKFSSALDAADYKTLNGSSKVDLTTISLGWKYNLSTISFGASLNHGFADATFKNSAERSLALRSYGLGFNFNVDGLFEEPWVVPFVEAEFAKLTLRETATTFTSDATYANASVITIGALIQLNWLDDGTALAALNSIGLENTFLRVGLQQASLNAGKLDSSGDVAPDLTSSNSAQVGMLLEF